MDVMSGNAIEASVMQELRDARALIVEDIDGEANGGEFLSDTLDIDYDKAVKVKEGEGRWYQGKFEVSQDVKLKKKP